LIFQKNQKIKKNKKNSFDFFDFLIFQKNQKIKKNQTKQSFDFSKTLGPQGPGALLGASRRPEEAANPTNSAPNGFMMP
jgi:hypothetical protein